MPLVILMSISVIDDDDGEEEEVEEEEKEEEGELFHDSFLKALIVW